MPPGGSVKPLRLRGAADVIFMDPPREGSTPQFIESVARMAPKRVVYVSCNPVTLARDLALLTKLGYRAEGFTPVDMFPNSEHIEVVCALSRQDIHGKKPPMKLFYREATKKWFVIRENL